MAFLLQVLALSRGGAFETPPPYGSSCAEYESVSGARERVGIARRITLRLIERPLAINVEILGTLLSAAGGAAG
jgi:hypothetical protein